MRTLILSTLAALAFCAPAHADQLLGQPRINNANQVVLPGGPALGRWVGKKYIATPDSVQIQGPGSTGPADGFSIQAPDGTTQSLSQASKQMRQVRTPKGAGMSTNPYSADDSTPATINRMNDRLFLGAATDNDGKGYAVAKDWLEALIPGSTSNGQFSSLAVRGNAGVVGGSRTSDLPAAGAQAAWGVGAFCLNNNTTQIQSCYGGYDEARRFPGAGITQSRESNILNGGSMVNVRPFAMGVDGLTAANWLSSGRNDVPGFNTSTSVGLALVNNGSNFLRGVVFGQDSIAGVANGTGLGEAITMASGHLMAWYTPDNTAGSYIGSVMTSSGFKGQNLLFQDDGPHFRNANGKDMLLVYSPPAASNGLKVISAVAGGSPSLLPGGADANIDMTIGAQGSGRVYLSAPTKVFATSVSGLPPASSCQDCVMVVTDAQSATYRGLLTGGGTVRTLAYSDGANWSAH